MRKQKFVDLPPELFYNFVQYIRNPIALSHVCSRLRGIVPKSYILSHVERHGRDRAVERFVADGLRDQLFLRLMVAAGCVIQKRPLLYAVEQGDMVLAKFLISLGAPLNETMNLGCNLWPFDICVLGRSVGRPRMKEMLLHAGARMPTGTAAFSMLCRLVHEKRSAELRILSNAGCFRDVLGDPMFAGYLHRLYRRTENRLQNFPFPGRFMA
jgi:hypothetical protein